MDLHNLQTLLNHYDLEPSALFYLLEEGIEIERLKLEVQRCSSGDSIESHIRIIHGERFLMLLTAAGIRR